MHFSFNRNKKLFFEGKKHGEDDEDERDDMIPSEGLRFEDGDHDDGKNGQRNGFLYDFQLDKVERASVLHGTDTVGGNHEGILKQCDAPRHQYDEKKRPVLWTGDDFK